LKLKGTDLPGSIWVKIKPWCCMFFNSSLRTRLSTQKAAMNLGMNTMVLNVGEDGWQMESELGVVMDGDKPEHLKEAIPVIRKILRCNWCSGVCQI
jgi:N-succinyl-L-ornithine transcarbamylase